MNVIDLDGNEHKWTLTGYISKGSMTNKSSLHICVRNILHECYPTMQILEEVPIPIRYSEKLYLDFYVPLLKKAIEVHGEQHYKYIPFYHSSRMGFIKHQKRDREKKEWCEINNLKLIELPYNATESEWREKILHE